MQHPLGKIAIKAAIKVVPKIAKKFSEKNHNISELSALEFVNVFLANPCNPKCFITETTCTPDEVLQTFLTFVSGITDDIALLETKDTWRVLAALKHPPRWFGKPGVYSCEHLMVAATKRIADTTSVIIGCRFITKYEADPIKAYAKASFERVREMAHLIQPNSGIMDLQELNASGAIHEVLGN